MTRTGNCARILLAAWLALPPTAWRAEAASPPLDAAVAATLRRDSARCRAKLDLDACYDAVRRNPGDASLNVALGDALMRAKRRADALRTYRRAAVLAPNTPGLSAKITALLQAKPSAKRPAVRSLADRTPVDRSSGKRFSNAAVDGQSH